MSTPVLVAIILLAVTCAAALTRLRLADRRSVAAHHRALETMGRLVAQHPPVESTPGPEQPAAQAHVRLVAGIEPEIPPASPPGPPRRSRARMRSPLPAEYLSWKDVAPVEPAPANDTRAPIGDGPAPVADEPAAVADEPVPVPDGPAPVADAPAPLGPPPVAVPAAMDDAAALSAPPTASLLHFDALVDDRPAASTGALSDGRHSQRSRRGLPPVRRRKRRSRRVFLRTGIGVLIVGLLAAGAVGGLLISRDPPARAPAAAPPPTAPTAPPTTTATTRPAPPGPVLVSSGVGYSEYRLSGPATIVLTASGRCWVEIRQNGPSGPVVYQGILAAGDTRGAPGSTWVRLGNPSNVTVKVNGVTISPPSLIAGQPYNLQFE